jgi:pyruvate kinase
LENMVKTGIPTRAEMTDATMAGQAECVMLNKGEFLNEAITLLDAILTQTQNNQTKKSAKLRSLKIAEKAWKKAKK